MFDFTNLSLYFDVFFSVFSVIILIAAVVFLPIGIFALKKVMRNIYGMLITLVLYFLFLLYISLKSLTLRGLFYACIFSDICLGAALAFGISIIVIRLREKAGEE